MLMATHFHWQKLQVSGEGEGVHLLFVLVSNAVRRESEIAVPRSLPTSRPWRPVHGFHEASLANERAQCLPT